MRELRENVRYQPARDRYKVFIVDEAHQITNEAFNALLKTIEEPPPWAVFVLCTTEAHKIPATIASRCQHFSFRSVDFEDLVARMAWICQQEGIEADSEALAVLAQSGEGSVRDALSALDQAIACCGAKLDAGAVRALLGAFSLESLEMVAQALLESDSRRMLEVVDELERNGHNLQHFARELARYFRNLLVARIAGEGTRLIAASPAQRQRLVEIASKFSEEDLTRYLQLSLDVFKDLQFSLQPRFHLEIGLVKLVQAGRLLPIEQALAELGGAGQQQSPPPPAASNPPRRSGPSPFEQDRARNAAAPTQVSAPKEEGRRTRDSSGYPGPPHQEGRPGGPPHPEGSDAREMLHRRLSELGHAHLADAVENSAVAVSGSELRIATSKNYKIYFGDPAMAAAVSEVFGKPLKLNVTVAESGGPAAPLAPPVPHEDEVRERALANPEVQRFQEVFEGSKIYKVRNLKEST
jgi:DNA polymerase-3 subunit gamma/tau